MIWTEVEAAAVTAGVRVGAGVVIRAPDGTPLAVLGRAVSSGSRQEALYRAILAALLRARRMGVRAVRLSVDDADLTGQLCGRRDIPPALIGLYLQARALLNAYRRREVRRLETPSAAALEAARRALEGEEASDGEDEAESLPLWRLVAR
ncbi:MAG: reverse transcriptase-like protein [Armatimonadota bacterium]|nr:reverse transcriptase-like protein [Armatimonadota bacterium]MDR7401047.1 reverse transcriptase-like protein [Armatimonadota bacterium]MDR7403255.1 reverse transcriptase-like protein [Armatimonadota bacterium]MDR7436342.1 reverse transcriptase-like protein [Armatimonadota bacterium]MDR7471170.1 reverse transcriptase-like protein [Armatimonadota bacterium]